MEIKFNVCLASWDSFTEKNCPLHDYFQQNTYIKSETLSKICPALSYLKTWSDVVNYNSLDVRKKESNLTDISFNFTLSDDLQNTEKVLQVFRRVKQICTKCQNYKSSR